MDELAMVVAERATAAVLIGESGPELGAVFRAAGLGHTERATSLDEAVAHRRPRSRVPHPPAPRVTRRPCCSARPRRASTCIPTTPRVVGTSRAPSALIAARGRRCRPMTVNARPRSAAQLPVSSAPASALLREGAARSSRGDRPAGEPAARARGDPVTGDARRPRAPRWSWPDLSTRPGPRGRRRASSRPARRSRARSGSATRRIRGSSSRPFALAAVGVLMIYSTRASLSADPSDITMAIAPELIWVTLGIVTMLALSRLDYRWLRLISVPLFLASVALLVIVLGPAIGPIVPKEVGGSARWLAIGGSTDHPCSSRSTPPRSPSWPWSSTSPTGWPAGAPPSAACSRAPCRSCASRAASSRSWPWSRTWAPPVSSPSPRSRCSSWPVASLWQLALMVPGRDAGRVGLHHQQRLPARPLEHLPRPVGDRRHDRLPHAPGAATRWASAALFGQGLGTAVSRAACRCRTRTTTSCSRWWARSWGSWVPTLVIVAVPVPRLARHPGRPAGARHLRRPAGHRHQRLARRSRRSSTSAWWSTCCP